MFHPVLPERCWPNLAVQTVERDGFHLGFIGYGLINGNVVVAARIGVRVTKRCIAGITTVAPRMQFFTHLATPQCPGRNERVHRVIATRSEWGR